MHNLTGFVQLQVYAAFVASLVEENGCVPQRDGEEEQTREKEISENEEAENEKKNKKRESEGAERKKRVKI